MSETDSTIFFFIFKIFSILVLTSAINTLEPTQQIRDGEFLISSAQNFRLGFFRPGNSQNRFVGIWFNNISVLTAVWVANRQTPLTDSNGVITLTNRGITVLNGNGTAVWSSGDNSSESSDTLVAQLLDSGNLILRDRNEMSEDRYTWQSFDHPTNILLAGMKLGRNNVTGVERHLSSWMNSDNPAVGNYTIEFDPTGFPQLVVKRDSRKVYVTGPWNGFRFSGGPNLQPNPYYRFQFVFDREEAYYRYDMIDDNAKMIFVMSLNGEVQRLMWSDRIQDWTIYLKLQVDNCDNYNSCGAFGKCTINESPQCGCLEKFQPQNTVDWNRADFSSGCVRHTPLDCQNGDGFARYRNVKLPDSTNSWYDRSMSLEECGTVCLRNCSCMAYSRLDIRARTGCLLWFGDLIDIRDFSESGQEIYIRLAASEVGAGSSKRMRVIYAVSFSLLVALILLGLSVLVYLRKKNNKKKKRAREEMLEHMEQSYSQELSAVQESNTNDKEDLELPLFDYLTIVNATDNFSTANKIGEGGFGPVYKGVLKDGNEIAVKKLSKSSRQGIDEFKNEVLCIAKLQHRNLVKLLGCCIQVETILIYEYMPNNSLDYFIFDEQRCALLDWPMLFNIINGISRGLLYLHQDSRLRIIHRDLKAGNILLDHEMNPKISDFGMARSFRGNETEANTTRVVGTYGYMSPEYAVDGLFSVKSDVFSFGVLVLEIVSGKKNRGFYHKEHYLNLLGHAWRLHNEGRSVELMNECLIDSCDEFEVLRSIHVGLLCVQQFPEDRPSMSTVVLMLSSVGELPQPKQPGFFTERMAFETNSSLYDSASIADNTSTLVMPR